MAKFPCEAVVLIPAGNPFIDPVFIDQLAAAGDQNPDCDYISFCRRDERPALLSPLGVSAEWCKCEALQRANATAPTRQWSPPSARPPT